MTEKHSDPILVFSGISVKNKTRRPHRGGKPVRDGRRMPPGQGGEKGNLPGEAAGSGGRFDSERLFEAAPVFVPLFARRFEVEDQVSHIEAELRDRTLDERKNLFAALETAGRPAKRRFETGFQFGGEFFDERAQFGEDGDGVFLNGFLFRRRGGHICISLLSGSVFAGERFDSARTGGAASCGGAIL